MAYEYVKQAYKVDPVEGAKVRHTVTMRSGVIAPESPSQNHYVQVRFGDADFAIPCHPTELDYQAT